MKKLLSFALLLSIACFSNCKVTIITGYDQTLDETVTQMQKDFNLHFIKLQRALLTQDGNHDQAYANFQDYYDHLDANIISVTTRSSFISKKTGTTVKSLAGNLIKALQDFESKHKSAENVFNDRTNDDRHGLQDAINTHFDSLILLEEKLKASGKAK
ncbi:hypothetical protein [Mucilaginibacter pedocola]|uniref:Lipoprotein n=1 Tax=Mucilaginibacter pedocola TaxID=1792845 RepID=A0A1S9PCT2_9SPHI|nr:hypothetical protein [Mucilaginibacter pedocola]OOQ58793.1 hypothetical protein BC343_09090 [Mucilaginibacter pedocola]